MYVISPALMILPASPVSPKDRRRHADAEFNNKQNRSCLNGLVKELKLTAHGTFDPWCSWISWYP